MRKCTTKCCYYKYNDCISNKITKHLLYYACILHLLCYACLLVLKHTNWIWRCGCGCNESARSHRSRCIGCGKHDELSDWWLRTHSILNWLSFLWPLLICLVMDTLSSHSHFNYKITTVDTKSFRSFTTIWNCCLRIFEIYNLTVFLCRLFIPQGFSLHVPVMIVTLLCGHDFAIKFTRTSMFISGAMTDTRM